MDTNLEDVKDPYFPPILSDSVSCAILDRICSLNSDISEISRANRSIPKMAKIQYCTYIYIIYTPHYIYCEQHIGNLSYVQLYYIYCTYSYTIYREISIVDQ